LLVTPPALLLFDGFADFSLIEAAAAATAAASL